MRVDIAIVGGGPAGLSAALNASIRQKEVMIIGPSTSEKLMKAEMIDNYLGLNNLSGEELLQQFKNHLTNYNITYRNEIVQVIYPMGEYIGLLLPNNEIVEADAVILATGVNFGRPIEGEQQFLGKGVSTCATCDAALYREKPVIVIGYNEHSVEEANFISEVASSTIFINQTGRSVELNEGIEEILEKPIRIEGDSVAKRLVFESRTIEADGFFFIRDAKMPDTLVPSIELEGNHIRVDEKMRTSIDGIFACGDNTGVPYQISRATGQGQVAGLEASSYVSKKKRTEGLS